jgi:predicted GNAT family N-acyltransferase
VPRDREYDGFENVSVHYLAMFQGRSIGCVRYRPYGKDIKIERLAVLKDFRNMGAGRALMEYVENEALDTEPEKYVLHSQVSAIPFYEKCGYHAEGPVFQDAFIDHREMIKEVPR